MIKDSSAKQSQQDKIKALTDTLKDGVLALRSSDEYIRYLKFQSKFTNYSFRNCLLILSQKEDATMVMGYKAWQQKGIERNVKKGETAIQILAPCPYDKKVKEKVFDENGNPVLDASGNQIKEEKQVKAMGFKVTYVFDVSQTEGKELPEIAHRLTGNVKDYDEIMDIVRAVSPVPIYIEEIESAANGYYSLSDKKIVIDKNLDEKHKVHTAFHELGHAYLHTQGLDEEKTRAEKEVEAESISFILLNHVLGDEITAEEAGQYSFGYLSSFSSDDSLPEFEKMLSTIQKASKDLIDMYDNEYMSRHINIEETHSIDIADSKISRNVKSRKM